MTGKQVNVENRIYIWFPLDTGHEKLHTLAQVITYLVYKKSRIKYNRNIYFKMKNVSDER